MVTRFSLPSVEEMRERLDRWIDRYGVAGVALGIMHGDEVRTAAAGVINTTVGVEATPDTLFQLGSVTKAYTTTLIMQFVDEGRVALDAPAITYLPDLRFADVDASRRITIRQLLTHTSGVDGDYFEDFGRGDDSVAKYVAACSALPQMFAPGTMWSYCNAGFVVLGRMIEVLTGMTWDRALKTRLLDPLGATRTVTLPEEALLYRTAAGHFVAPPSRELALSPIWGMPRCSGPAGATPCATVEDLLLFARMHLDGGRTRDGAQILSRSSAAAMQEAQVELPSQPGEGASHWGLGWMLFHWGGQRVFGHDGGTIGQAASLRILPEERLGVAVLTNTTPTGSVLASRAMRWLFGQHAGLTMPERPNPPESPPMIRLAPYVGVYEKIDTRIKVEERDGALRAVYINTGPFAGIAPEQPPTPLIPVSETLFLQQVAESFFQPVTFSQFEDGHPRYLFTGRVFRRLDS